MNAQGIKDQAHLDRLLQNPDYICQEKLDGMRALVHVTPDGLRIFSRSAGVADSTRPLEKTAALPHLAELKFPDLFGSVLDCEILIQGRDSATVAGAINRKELKADNTKVKLFVFDCLHICGRSIMDQPLRYRLDILFKNAHKISSRHIIILPYFNTPATKRNLYENVFAGNGEGVMLKNLNATYLEGGRPAHNWYKVKKSASYDCIVMGFSLGKGKYNTQIGAVKFGQYVNGKLIELGQASGMSDEERLLMSRYQDQYIGKVVTIKGMERLKSGAIRHPQFGGLRKDKKPTECIWYQGEQ